MKKRNLKKALSLGLAAALALGAMVGCQGNPAGSTNSSSGSPSSQASSGEKTSLYKYKEPVTLKFMFPEDTKAKLPTINESKVLQELRDKTNVTIEFVAVPSGDDYTTRFNTQMSSQEIYDLTWGRAGWLNLYGKDGAFLDLTKYMDKIPEVKRWIDADAEFCKSNLYNQQDGGLYALPRFNQMRNSVSWMVRGDWLEKCGLKEPTTMEEFADVLRAFKEKDPDGVGKDNVIPFASRTGFSQFFINSLPAWGMYPGYYTMAADGTCSMNMLNPKMKEAVSYWAQLYSEGLMDKEYLTRKDDEWVANITSGKSGATLDYGVRTDQFTSALQGNGKADAVMAAIAPPAGPNGDRGIASYASTFVDSSVGIAASCKYPEAALCLLNYIYSDEGSKLLSWGIDGYTYNGVDSATGFPKWNDELKAAGSDLTVANGKYFILNASFPRPITAAEADLLYGPQSVKAIEKDKDHWIMPYDAPQFTKEQDDALNEYFTALSSKYIEGVNQFIMGQRPMSDWDKYVAELKTETKVVEIGELYTAGQKARIANTTVK